MLNFDGGFAFAVALSNIPGTKGLWLYCLPFSNVSFSNAKLF